MDKVIFLRNSTRTGLLQKAEENGFYFKDEDGNTFIPQGGESVANGHAQLFYKGKISNNDAVLDEEGNVITPATFKSGWHADLYLSVHNTPEDFNFGDMVIVVNTPETEYGAQRQ